MKPHNAITKLEYQGKNVGCLRLSKEMQGFKSDGWLTFIQARQNGYKVKKGAQGTHIFCGFVETIDLDEHGKSKVVTVPKTAIVFNLDQVSKA